MLLRHYNKRWKSLTLKTCDPLPLELESTFKSKKLPGRLSWGIHCLRCFHRLRVFWSIPSFLSFLCGWHPLFFRCFSLVKSLIHKQVIVMATGLSICQSVPKVLLTSIGYWATTDRHISLSMMKGMEMFVWHLLTPWRPAWQLSHFDPPIFSSICRKFFGENLSI